MVYTFQNRPRIENVQNLVKKQMKFLLTFDQICYSEVSSNLTRKDLANWEKSSPRFKIPKKSFQSVPKGGKGLFKPDVIFLMLR